jgi:ATP-dependent Zn protease
LLDLAYDEAKQILVAHRDQLTRVATELLKYETIDGPTFYQLVGKETPPLEGALQAAAAQPKVEAPVAP